MMLVQVEIPEGKKEDEEESLSITIDDCETQNATDVDNF